MSQAHTRLEVDQKKTSPVLESRQNSTSRDNTGPKSVLLVEPWKQVQRPTGDPTTTTSDHTGTPHTAARATLLTHPSLNVSLTCHQAQKAESEDRPPSTGRQEDSLRQYSISGIFRDLSLALGHAFPSLAASHPPTQHSGFLGHHRCPSTWQGG